jgi:hypothetical protein
MPGEPGLLSGGLFKGSRGLLSGIIFNVSRGLLSGGLFGESWGLVSGGLFRGFYAKVLGGHCWRSLRRDSSAFSLMGLGRDYSGPCRLAFQGYVPLHVGHLASPFRQPPGTLCPRPSVMLSALPLGRPSWRPPPFPSTTKELPCTAAQFFSPALNRHVRPSFVWTCPSLSCQRPLPRSCRPSLECLRGNPIGSNS